MNSGVLQGLFLLINFEGLHDLIETMKNVYLPWWVLALSLSFSVLICVLLNLIIKSLS